MLHQPRKRFGQNFLVDPHIIKKIILAIRPQATDDIIEIGPGHGALTRPLLDCVNKLSVIEIDRDLCATLCTLDRLTVHCEDVLNVDFASLTENAPMRIVGNLPYNISTPLLFHLFKYTSQIIDMHFMLQKEVVDRMSAGPGNKNYGRLSVMTQYYAEVEKLFEVKPGSFNPAPKVTSAIVRLIPRAHRELAGDHEKKFADLVKQSFSQRRKTLRNNLKLVLNEQNIMAGGIDPGSRAESLTLQDFIRLYKQSLVLN
jgi:16S rRNA (adenine1518-N6/adenine1519-N6)-dimethyltransferase